MKHRAAIACFVLVAGVFSFPSTWAAPVGDAATRKLAREIFKQLIEINTTDSVGNVSTAAQAMAQRLLAPTPSAGWKRALFPPN